MSSATRFRHNNMSSATSLNHAVLTVSRTCDTGHGHWPTTRCCITSHIVPDNRRTVLTAHTVFPSHDAPVMTTKEIQQHTGRVDKVVEGVCMSQRTGLSDASLSQGEGALEEGVPSPLPLSGCL
ncbi:hypothetical protein ACOMHN_009061 [Nucella lapillus]